MKTLYLECNAGASGDMILGALTDLLDDPLEFKSMMDSLAIPHLKVSLERSETFSISGMRVHITVDGVEEGHDEHGHEHHHHEHHTLSNVLGVIHDLDIPDKVREDAEAIYRTIAEAEAEVHGKSVDLIHFHEVGAIDAIADIVGACLLFNRLNPDQIISTPVRTGYGQVRCAHGLLPVPAPATASIIKGMKVYAGDEEGEFCTPTGAAILKHFVDRFEQMPDMLFENMGIGLGHKQFRTANMLRAFIGETQEVLPVIKEIDCNIDDMTSEDLGGIIGMLLDKGALDAFVSSSLMKKGRMGFQLTCLCRKEDLDEMAHLILAHTSTIGLRVHDCERYAMNSRFETCHTSYGDIRIKVSEGFGITKWKPEHDDLVEASRKHGVSVTEVRDSIRFEPKQ